MSTRTFQTDLSCEGCLEAMRPLLDQEASIARWSIDVNHADKPATIEGDAVDWEKVRTLFESEGYHLLRELPGNARLSNSEKASAQTVKPASLQTYAPLILILAYLLGVVALTHPANAMNAFMGGFFLIFSFFKLLNLKGFADAYQTYDALAKHSRAYAFTYPFLELILGASYVSGFEPKFTNLATFLLMGFSSIGVIQSLVKKRTIQCACLGTVFNLPMTKVTVFEDLLMAAMALYSLLA